MSVVEMTSSSMITGDAFESVEFSSDSDTDSWQVVDDPFDSDNDVVITTESDVITSDEDEDEDEDDEEEDVALDDVIDEEDEDDSVYDDEDDSDVDDEEDVDDVITFVDEITNHSQELNEVHEALKLVYNVKMSDLMKKDLYIERMLMERVVEEEKEEEEDDEDDDYDEDDLDDEVVPRWLNNKFERQRMRKLGKKVHPKMKKSKRMVNQYNRPGCAGAKFQMW